jgi:hypothetical protein
VSYLINWIISRSLTFVTAPQHLGRRLVERFSRSIYWDVLIYIEWVPIFLLRNDQNSGQKNYYFVVSHGSKSKNYYSTSTDLPHIMVNIRQFLLSLLPVICGRPPPVFLTPTFAATVSDSSNFSYVIEVIVLVVVRHSDLRWYCSRQCFFLYPSAGATKEAMHLPHARVRAT